ncbi:hypothetical protein LJC31_03135 [Synergistaceae bacterium OttesenSCG-928-I11]|nr:hypothetical protein [Synergistaceae bacterium OttesenSCG-928-I11]
MRGNRKICAYLLLTFLFSLCPFQMVGAGAATAAEATPWDGSTTTQPQLDDDGVYLISTGAELAWIAKMVAEDNATYGAASYRQTADIDLGGKAWTPIGTIPEENNGSDLLSLSFKGAYDGGGYTISGLAMSGEARLTGFFGAVVDPEALLVPTRAQAVGGGVISNVHLRDVSISLASTASGITYVGGLVGVNFYGTMENCSVTGSVEVESTGVRSQVYAGGLIGGSAYGTIAGCFSVTEVRASSTGRVYAGGLAGSNNGVLRGCFATGDVHAESSGDEETACAGGLVGISNGGAEFCLAKGDVYATSAGADEVDVYAGGFIGHVETDDAIFGSAATGNVYAKTTDGNETVQAYAGGFAGLLMKGTISESFATGNVSAEVGEVASFPYAGGFIGDNKSVVKNCFATGNALAKKTDNTDIVADYAYAGGFAGRSSDGSTIETSYAYGTVEALTQKFALAGGFAGFFHSAAAITDCFWFGTTTINTTLPPVGYTTGSVSIASLDVAAFTDPAKFTNWDFTDVWTHSEINGKARPHLLAFVDAAGVISGDMACVMPDMIAIAPGETRELRLSAMGWEASADNVGTTADLSAYGLTLTQHETSPDVLILTALANAEPASRDVAVTFEVNSIAQTARAIEVVVTAPADGDLSDPSNPSDFQTVYDGLSDDQKLKLRDGANLILDGAVNPSDLGTISVDETLTLDVWFVLSNDQGSWDIDPSYDGKIMTASIYEGENDLVLGIGEVWDPSGTLSAYETVSDDVTNGLAQFVFGKPDGENALSISRGKALAEGPHFVAVYDDTGKLVLDPMTVTVGDTQKLPVHSSSGVGCDAGYAAFGIFGLLPLLPLIVKRRR